MASQSTVPAVSEEEILLCCVCLETLDEPKILQCLHRLCKKCLVKVIGKVPSDESFFQCPTCRNDQSLPENGADGVSDDFLLRGILENRKLEKDIKNEKKDQTCSSCKRFTSVVAICPHCGGFICETCHTGHTLMRIFEDHSHMVTLKDIESGKVEFDVHKMKAVSNTPKCSSHKDMTLHINCKTCDQLICPVCAPLHHQNHEFEEIHAAAKRVKDIISALVEESKGKEEVLGEGMEEVKRIRNEYKEKIGRVREDVAVSSQSLEEGVRSKRERDLDELQEKKHRIEQEAEENLLEISRERQFLKDEMQMVETFVRQSLDHAETEKNDSIRKVKDCQATASILTRDTDSWSLLKAAPDIQKVLSMGQEDTSMQHFKNTNLNFQELTKSALTELCWKKGGYEEQFQGLSVFPSYDYSSVSISNIRGLEGEGQLSVAVICRKKKGNYMYTDQAAIAVVDLKNLTFEPAVEIWAKHETIYHVGTSDDSVFYSVCVEGLDSWLNQNNELITYVDLPSKVRCCSPLDVSSIDEGLLAGTEESTCTLYILDYDGEVLSQISVEEDGLGPPVSLSVIKTERIFLCDGEGKALAITREGEVTSRFLGRCATDKPLKIAGDDNGLVYVLWGIEDGARRMRDMKTGAGSGDSAGKTGEEDDDSEEDKDVEDSDDLSMKRVLQYSPEGTYISEVYVEECMTLMTTMTGEDGEVLVLASPNNKYQFFEMTPFGKMFSQFVVQSKDKTAQNGEDGKEDE